VKQRQCPGARLVAQSNWETASFGPVEIPLPSGLVCTIQEPRLRLKCDLKDVRLTLIKLFVGIKYSSMHDKH
jgi:hypothetical protein